MYVHCRCSSKFSRETSLNKSANSLIADHVLWLVAEVESDGDACLFGFRKSPERS